MPELGRAALIVCLGLALYAVVAGGLAAWQRRRRLAESAQNAVVASFAAALIGSLVLLVALVQNDFSFVYVADHTSRDLPLGYTISAFWGGQEGSLLLWLLILTGFSAIAVLLARRRRRACLHGPCRSSGRDHVLSRSCSSRCRARSRRSRGFGWGRPQPEPPNPYMLAHPPMLYLGFVGLTIPFAFAMGALAARRNDELDRRHASMDARRLDVSRLRQLLGATGHTSRWAGAAISRGIPSRTRR